MQGPLTTINGVISVCRIDAERYRLLRKSKDAKGDYYYVDRLWQLSSGRVVVILNYVGENDKDQVLLLFSRRKVKLLRERKFDSLAMGFSMADDQLFYLMPRKGEWATIDTLTLRPARGELVCISREPYLLNSSFTSDGKLICVQERPKNTEKDCRVTFLSYDKGNIELLHQQSYQVYSTNFDVMLLDTSHRAAISVEDETTFLVINPKEKTSVRHHLTKAQCKNIDDGKFYVKQVVELTPNKFMLWTVSLTSGKHSLLRYNELDRTQPPQLMVTGLNGPFNNIIDLGQWLYIFEQDKISARNQPASEVTIHVMNKTSGKELYS